MAIVTGCVARSRLRAGSSADSRRLVHPRSTLAVGLAGFLLFAGTAVLSNVYSNRDDHVVDDGGIRFLRAPLPLVIADYFLARHELSEEGLHFRRLTGSRGYLRSPGTE